MTKQQTKLLQVAQLGHPVIREVAKELKSTNDPEVQRLIDDMIATLYDMDGVGIAAPQVYQSLRIFIIASHPNAHYPYAPNMKPTAIINPKILKASEEKVKDWEGCLSIPGIRGLVPRHTTIRVEYTTREGQIVRKTFKDFVARIFQHEYDHIEGIVFLDRMDSTKEIVTEKEYQKLIAKK